jgi:Sec-independent protein secretion pathway component TatC
MLTFLSEVLNTTIYIAGIGALILAIPTIIFLYLASKVKDGPEYHHHHIFLAVMAVALFGGLFFNVI